MVMAPIEIDQSRFNLAAQNDAKRGAVLILFYPDSGDIHFPLIRRSTYEGVHSGQVALPGGKKEKEDADLFTTAIREASEEIGIDRNKVTIIGSLTEVYIPVSNFKVLPVLGYYTAKPIFIPDYEEVEEIIIANIQMFNNSAKHKITEIQIAENFSIRAPYFDVDHRKIWGATAMMLGELMVVLNS